VRSVEGVGETVSFSSLSVGSGGRLNCGVGRGQGRLLSITVFMNTIFLALGRVSYFAYLCSYYQMRVYMFLRAPGLEHTYDTRLLSIIHLHPADAKGVILHNLPVSSALAEKDSPRPY
jgi:hypothetical protein